MFVVRRLLALLAFPMFLACATSEDVGEDTGGGGAPGGFGGTAFGGSGGSSAGGAGSGGGGLGATGGVGASGGLGGAPTGGSGGLGGTPSGGGSGGSGGLGGAGGTASGGGGAGGTGVGGAPSCAVLGCVDGSESGAGCAQARVIGRKTASKAGGFQVTASTCSAANDISGYDAASCQDSGRDRSYRMYLKKFEKVDVLLTQGAKCSGAQSWERVFKIYSGTSCTDQSCGKKLQCAYTYSGTWAKSFEAPEDGWYVFVVDGRNGPGSGDDSGDFTLTLSLLCVFGGCEC